MIKFKRMNYLFSIKIEKLQTFSAQIISHPFAVPESSFPTSSGGVQNPHLAEQNNRISAVSRWVSETTSGAASTGSAQESMGSATALGSRSIFLANQDTVNANPYGRRGNFGLPRIYS